MKSQIREMRIAGVNKVIQAIASCGRKFFLYEDRVAVIEQSATGHLFLINEWNQKRIYISKYGAWRGFHHGGTLHALVGRMVAYIQHGEVITEDYFSAKHWGYHDDMQTVINAAKQVGFVKAQDTEREMSKIRKTAKSTKPKLRDACQFLAWLASEEPEVSARFYDYCNGAWGAAKSHAAMLWEAGQVAGCYEIMTEDWKGERKVCMVNVQMVPHFDCRAKQDP